MLDMGRFSLGNDGIVYMGVIFWLIVMINFEWNIKNFN